MDGETIITWNATNWITVVLMVFLGFLIVGAVSQLIRKGKGQSAENA